MEFLENDIVSLVKNDGTKYNSVKATVVGNSIILKAQSFPIEVGDVFERVLPTGILEEYLIEDPNYFNGGSGIPAFYQCKVSKKGITKNNNQNITYNLNGNNSKVNINSTDSSTNVLNTADNKIFDQLVEVINSQIPDKKEELIKCVEEMKLEKGKEGFVQKYQNFMSNAANHITVFAPFLPALALLL